MAISNIILANLHLVTSFLYFHMNCPINFWRCRIHVKEGCGNQVHNHSVFQDSPGTKGLVTWRLKCFMQIGNSQHGLTNSMKSMHHYCEAERRTDNSKNNNRWPGERRACFFSPQLCYSRHVYGSNLQDPEAPPGVWSCGILTPRQVRFEHIPSVFLSPVLISIQLCDWKLKTMNTLRALYLLHCLNKCGIVVPWKWILQRLSFLSLFLSVFTMGRGNQALRDSHIIAVFLLCFVTILQIYQGKHFLI